MNLLSVVTPPSIYQFVTPSLIQYELLDEPCGAALSVTAHDPCTLFVGAGGAFANPSRGRGDLLE